MRVLVCGSRGWNDDSVIFTRLERLGEEDGWDITIVHGDARGADTYARAIAAYFGFKIETHPPDWKRHGRAAGFIRNVEMLESGIDRVLAFQRNGSRGTQHTIDEARRRGIPVEVFTS